MQENGTDTTGMSEDLERAAGEILLAIWHWNYVDWEAMAPLVTGPMAKLLRANMAESEEAPSRTLCELAISDSGFLEDGFAWVRAVYTWQETGDGNDEGSETMVWTLKNEDGRWKACSVGRSIPQM